MTAVQQDKVTKSQPIDPNAWIEQADRAGLAPHVIFSGEQRLLGMNESNATGEPEPPRGVLVSDDDWKSITDTLVAAGRYQIVPQGKPFDAKGWIEQADNAGMNPHVYLNDDGAVDGLHVSRPADSDLAPKMGDEVSQEEYRTIEAQLIEWNRYSYKSTGTPYLGQDNASYLAAKRLMDRPSNTTDQWKLHCQRMRKAVALSVYLDNEGYSDNTGVRHTVIDTFGFEDRERFNAYRGLV
ncbi:MAG: hypothetical protein RIM72_22320 [Alphaproteobacteria bacterium]